ncbi:MAG: hypothetical protein EOL87_18370 [Spartobacteria bacterium]|nr:hypothetical protein [Spartobacteria bacterium]
MFFLRKKNDYFPNGFLPISTQFREEALKWTFNPPDTCSQISPEYAITGTALACLDDAEYSPDQCALVVPDDFGEGAQQAVLDVWRRQSSIPLHLVPRPVAAATEWCSRQDAVRYCDVPDHEDIGHVLVIHLGMDRWECSCLNIRVRKYNGRTVLVPVRDHTLMTSALPTTGLRWLLARSKLPESERWNDVFCAGLTHHLHKQKTSMSSHEWNHLSSKRKASLEQWFGDDYQEQHDHDTLDKIKASLQKKYQDLRKNNNLHKTQLYTLVTGPLATIRTDGMKLGTFLAADMPRGGKLMLGRGDTCGSGAATIAMQLSRKQPTYYDRLAPIDIYTHQTNKDKDIVLRPEPIIKAEVVEAGRVYKTAEPLTGFMIPRGRESVDLQIRRGGENAPAYRQGTMQFREKFETDVDIEISAEASPGQGRARIHIASQTRGNLHFIWEWHKMESLDHEPEPTNLAWPPGMAMVLFDYGYWKRARNLFDSLYDACIAHDRELIYELVSRCRSEHMNKWHRDPSHNYNRHHAAGTGIAEEDRKYSLMYAYYGALPSDSFFDLADYYTRRRDKMLHIVDSITDDLIHHIGTKAYRDALRLFCAWLYGACPDRIRNNALMAIELGNADNTDRTLVGNCVRDIDDLQCVSDAFVVAIQSEVNNYWLMAYRNIIRFRVESVSQEVISAKKLLLIVEKLSEIIQEKGQQIRPESDDITHWLSTLKYINGRVDELNEYVAKCETYDFQNDSFKTAVKNTLNRMLWSAEWGHGSNDHLEALELRIKNGEFVSTQRIFNNCVYILPHLLKRRKFEKDFLKVGSREEKALCAVIQEALNLWLKPRQHDYLKATLTFLERKGDLAGTRVIHEVQ